MARRDRRGLSPLQAADSDAGSARRPGLSDFIQNLLSSTGEFQAERAYPGSTIFPRRGM